MFIGLAAAYVSDFFAILGLPFAESARLLASGQSGWLLYLTWAATLNFAAGYHLMV